jgi:amino acid adenylation domain-containing protein
MTNDGNLGHGSPAPPGGRVAGLSAAAKKALQQRLRIGAKAPASLSIGRRPDDGPGLLSFAQERLWLLDQLLPRSMAYNVPRALRLRGRLDETALQKALDALVLRHEILRTVYTANDGVPRQVVTAGRPVEWTFHDLRGLPAADREAEAWRLLNREIQRPFDLSADLMLRAVLIRLADEDNVLLLMSHHIASDGWSRGVLFRELAALYEVSRLAELPIQYADFAAWQRTKLAEQLGEHLAYWKERLAEAPPLLELPTDRPRPAMQSYAGATLYRRFPGRLLQGLRGLSQKEGTTLFMTLLAAFQVLLHRWTGQADLLVGTPVSGRNRVETEPLIGDFVNMLVLRTDLGGDPPFRELLRRVRAMALEAYEHAELPFEKLVAELQPERALSYSPLFQVMFALERGPAPGPEFPGLSCEPLDIATPTAKHDLLVSLLDDGQELRGGFEYATGLFDAATVERLIGHFQCLLEGIVADPGQRLSALPLLTQAEQRQTLIEWNATREEFSRGEHIHSLFEAQAARRPDAPALWFEGQRLTYGELNRRANQLAHYLRKQGVGLETRVGICVERCPEMIVGMLGIMKAGGAYVPLDPTLPRDRLGFMTEDAQVPLLLSQERLRDRLPEQTAHVIYLDADWGRVAGESGADLRLHFSDEHLAYVIFTSGSTGRPKGVQLPHRAVVNFLRHMHRRPGMTQRDTHLGVATMSFDASILDFYVPLTAGACLAIVPREATTDPWLLAEALRHSATTVMHATASTWRLLLESGWPGDKGLKVLAGGEALPWALAQQLLDRSAEVWNLYGPTETAVYSTIHRVEPADGAVLVGRPIANTQVYLLDRHNRPVPVGVPGEVCIGGAGVSRGYLNRPELTAEKYVPDPFGSEAGSRLYRTGDLGRYRPDGTLECLGRIDHQVKVRGHRIELGEIEAVLRQHPSVREAVALAWEDVPGDKRLVAYVVAVPGQEPAERELHAFLQEKLPEYMVPSAFVTLESLPLSPNRKVNRSALPRPEQTGQAEEEFVPPATPLEQTLADIWAGALGVERIGCRDNFFRRGGHSLLAMQVVARVRDALQVDLPVRLLFEVPTLADMARAVEQLLLQGTSTDEMAALLADLESSMD